MMKIIDAVIYYHFLKFLQFLLFYSSILIVLKKTHNKVCVTDEECDDKLYLRCHNGTCNCHLSNYNRSTKKCGKNNHHPITKKGKSIFN